MPRLRSGTHNSNHRPTQRSAKAAMQCLSSILPSAAFAFAGALCMGHSMRSTLASAALPLAVVAAYSNPRLQHSRSLALGPLVGASCAGHSMPLQHSLYCSPCHARLHPLPGAGWRFCCSATSPKVGAKMSNRPTGLSACTCGRRIKRA